MTSEVELRTMPTLKVIFSSILFLGMMSLPGYAEEPPEMTKEEASALKEVERVLEEALRKKDFSGLKPDAPIVKPPLFWTACWSNREKISFEEMVARLTELSKGAKILVNPRSVNMLSEMVETYGWNGENQYLYFDFDFGFDRWYGVHECADRSSDFTYKGEDGFPDKVPGEPKGTLAKLNKSIQTGDYGPMRERVPSGKPYLWGGCGPGDALPAEYSFEEITETLQKDTREKEIKILGEARVFKGWGGPRIKASIKTLGWKGKYPYVEFLFDLSPDQGWIWTGVCDSAVDPAMFY